MTIDHYTLPDIPGLPTVGNIWTGTNRSERKVGTSKGDTFFGMGGNDTLIGYGGNDILDGNMGRDVIKGGLGNDAITLLGADTVTGGGGLDFFMMVGVNLGLGLGTANRSIITDFKDAGYLHDVIQLAGYFRFEWKDRDGDIGDGFSIVRKGADTLITTRDVGGNIQKILVKNTLPREFTQENLMIVPLPGLSAPAAPAAPIEGGDGADSLPGGKGDDFITGGAGNDTLRGFAGDDELNGMAGADRMFGGRGADRIYVSGGDKAFGGHGADTFVLLSPADFADIADDGRAVAHDFHARGTHHDVVELSLFDVTWADRDLGLEDGFELRKVQGGVKVSLMDSDGDVVELLLKGTALKFLTEDNFIF